MLQLLLNIVNAVDGFRKTIVMGLIIVLTIIFRIEGLISGDNVAQLLQGTVVAFFAANGLEHITNTVKEYINSDGKKVDENIISVTEE